MCVKSIVLALFTFLLTVQARSQTQLIHDVRVFDGEHVLEHRSVLIENGKISRIETSLKAPNAEIIEGHNRTLLPGLIDAHVTSLSTCRMPLPLSVLPEAKYAQRWGRCTSAL